MFNQDQNGGAVTALSAQDIFGMKLDQAELIKSRTFPAGFYILGLADYESAQYDITAEDHPLVGQQGTRVVLKFNVLAVDTSGTTHYDMLQDTGKYVRVPTEEVQERVGEEISHSVMFGNDGLADKKTGKITHRGRDEMFTLLTNFIGEDNFNNAGIDPRTLSVIELIELAKKYTCIVPVKNTADRNDKARIYSNIDVIGKFAPQNPT